MFNADTLKEIHESMGIVAAIKYVRNETGMSLRNSKNVMKAICRDPEPCPMCNGTGVV